MTGDRAEDPLMLRAVARALTGHEPSRDEVARLDISLHYQGPFGRLMNWLWALDPVTNELRREVKDGSVRGWLAARADWADRCWRAHYVKAGRRPPERWKRRERTEAP